MRRKKQTGIYKKSTANDSMTARKLFLKKGMSLKKAGILSAGGIKSKFLLIEKINIASEKSIIDKLETRKTFMKLFRVFRVM
jgi:hypothetical protein